MTGRFEARVLGVHGIRNRPDSLTTVEAADNWLAEAWYQQLCFTIGDRPLGRGLTVEVPYFAHLLNEDRTIEHGRQPLEGQWLKPDRDTWDFFHDLAVTWRRGEPTSDAQAVAVIQDKCGIGLRELSLLARRHWRELTTYLVDAPIRDAVTDLVRERMIRFEPEVVIGHDLGALVAYEALARAGTPATKLITLGAPWGSHWVRRRLSADNRSLPRPPGAATWTDLYCRGDVFCAGRPGSGVVSGPWRQHSTSDPGIVRHGTDETRYLADPHLGEQLLDHLEHEPDPKSRPTFFISYAETQLDRSWAEWIAWELEAAKYQVMLKSWDLVPGMNPVNHTHNGLQTAERMILVLSRAYLRSTPQTADWQAMFRRDVPGEERRLIPVRIEDCDAPGLLDRRGIDLFGLNEDTARHTLRKGVAAAVTGDNRPDGGNRPPFPGGAGQR
ncbi:toll/interleukin-1 receptor domain-containing protein [Actinoplanes derwentensis]|uniref:TIR domain-containing protein n=1 Tax=Actinoplanes derwentensis TaxID=113562 RepID=A0A1H2AIY5_9ACTN|nr:toll/interleukin-1 receptor domain-containing protein [Actinoplanes derwentensis]GID90293.1 hypothetical protein Ade03nite_92170 [Actinoplanes derwentensis]SDT45918.1 TIR domain-containing protein [Actinoplanes derwentensis]